jgi:phosphatidylserine/phosphatidylglycerophosphate/cardiolipin synthase-like enzyme
LTKFRQPNWPSPNKLAVPATAPPDPLTDSAPAFALLQGAQAFFPALIADIDAAGKTVQLETYIFDLHGSGVEVAQALMLSLIHI